MHRPTLETASPPHIRRHQLARLNVLLTEILPANRFYARKFTGVAPPVREFEVDEFRIVRTRHEEMEQLEVHLEAADAVGRKVADALRRNLGIRIPTTVVASGSLPRFELKARRVLDLRNEVTA